MNHTAFNNFMPHGHCYFWTPEILWPMVVSDVSTGVSYVALTVLLIIFARKRPDIPYRWIFWGFGSFILACGIGHFIDAWNIWHGDYVMQAAWRVVTALVSVAVAIVGVKFFPKFLNAPSTVQLQEANERIEQLNKLVVYQTRFNKHVVNGVASTREGLVLEAIQSLKNDDIKRLKEIFNIVSLGAARFRLSMGDFLINANTNNLSHTVMKLCKKFKLDDRNVRGSIFIEHDSKSITKALDELVLNAVEAGDSAPVVTLKSKDKTITLTIENMCEYTPILSDMDIPYYTTNEIGRGLGFPYAKWVFLKHGAEFSTLYENKKITVKAEFKQ